MIVTIKKDFQEILEAIGGMNRIFIVGCGDCATTCKTGGEREVLEMKGMLESKGKTVTGYSISDAPCVAGQVAMLFAKNKRAIDDTDGFLVLACGLGAQSILENDRKKRPVYVGCDTMFGSILDKTGLGFFERCSMCGECVLNITGGICPVTYCAKGLLNGPCGGSNRGKCEVNKDRDCAWILIYQRLKDLRKLENLKKIRPAKDYSKSNKPREIVLK